ncbi:hypothetical protein AVEN_162659-1 [Araneus ventricosus]|uniref:Uncharacterized protein n=1 Tax=Araneus ventricosus TaxID=182803 RepID=A0A4Y2FCP2_ARAVE|nr:hypothetical protein AVEN_162659-1 [Araneus ventricosus]
MGEVVNEAVGATCWNYVKKILGCGAGPQSQSSPVTQVHMNPQFNVANFSNPENLQAGFNVENNESKTNIPSNNNPSQSIVTMRNLTTVDKNVISREAPNPTTVTNTDPPPSPIENARTDPLPPPIENAVTNNPTPPIENAVTNNPTPQIEDDVTAHPPPLNEIRTHEIQDVPNAIEIERFIIDFIRNAIDLKIATRSLGKVLGHRARLYPRYRNIVKHMTVSGRLVKLGEFYFLPGPSFENELRYFRNPRLTRHNTNLILLFIETHGWTPRRKHVLKYAERKHMCIIRLDFELRFQIHYHTLVQNLDGHFHRFFPGDVPRYAN